MGRHNQPKIISAHVENEHLPAAFDPHRIGVWISPPNLGQTSPFCRPDNPAPCFQVTGGFGVQFPRLHQKRFFDDAHAYNLYSKGCSVNPGSEGASEESQLQPPEFAFAIRGST